MPDYVENKVDVLTLQYCLKAKKSQSIRESPVSFSSEALVKSQVTTCIRINPHQVSFSRLLVSNDQMPQITRCRTAIPYAGFWQGKHKINCPHHESKYLRFFKLWNFNPL